MSFEALMKDTGKINALSVTNEYGHVTYTLGAEFRCRFSSQQGSKALTTTGEEALIDGFVFFPASVTVNEKDQIQVNGVMYRLINLFLQSNYSAGHHYKAAVRRV